MRLQSTILLAVCLINFACVQAVRAGSTKQKLSDSPVDFKVEEHKAEQKLVFKLGLPMFGQAPEIIQNAVKTALATFHEWGANIEKTCHNLDHLLKADDPPKSAPPFLKQSLSTAGEGVRAAKTYLTQVGRPKAIAER